MWPTPSRCWTWNRTRPDFPLIRPRRTGRAMCRSHGPHRSPAGPASHPPRRGVCARTDRGPAVRVPAPRSGGRSGARAGRSLPSSISSGMPLIGVETTGSRWLWASTITLGKPSRSPSLAMRQGSTNRSLARYSASTRVCACLPRNVTLLRNSVARGLRPQVVQQRAAGNVGPVPVQVGRQQRECIEQGVEALLLHGTTDRQEAHRRLGIGTIAGRRRMGRRGEAFKIEAVIDETHLVGRAMPAPPDGPRRPWYR